MNGQLSVAVLAAYSPGAQSAAALEWLQHFQGSPEAWQVRSSQSCPKIDLIMSFAHACVDCSTPSEENDMRYGVICKTRLHFLSLAARTSRN